MKGFYIYNLILEVILLNMVDCQITSEEVYSLLSQRLNLENTLLRNELKELKAVIKKQDEKIDALSLSAHRTPETVKDANENQDLKIQITVMQHALQSEKELMRGIQSNVSSLESKLEKEIVTEIISSASELESKLQTELAAEIKASASELESKLQTELAAEIKASASELDSKLQTELSAEIKASASELESKLQTELAAEIKASTSELESKLEKKIVTGINASTSEVVSIFDRKKVAFSAELTKSTSELAIGSKIVFNQIVYQDGNGYNSTDGVFTCPETGVYMFSVVLHCFHGNDGVKTLAAKLVVDSEEKSYVVSESQHSLHNDQASNLVILSVNQGQKVWVQTYQHDSKVFRSFSTFSGALLYN